MATPLPFSVSGSLNFPEAPGLPQDPIPLNVSCQFTQLAQFVLSLTGTGTKSVDLGTISAPGLKGLLVTVDVGVSVTPITVKVNASSTGGREVSAGGLELCINPTPSTGITAISIDYTSTCVVRIWALG